jgi:hypothetical protein
MTTVKYKSNHLVNVVDNSEDVKKNNRKRKGTSKEQFD